MTNMSTAQQNDQKSIEDIEANYLEICRQLNMDKDTEKAAWQSYVEVTLNSTLQGDPNHWLCCAVYAACRESYTPTVGNSNAVVAGNCVSLTKLLRNCNISINEFCNKIKVWANIKNISRSLRSQIVQLEQSVQVSRCIYQKYEEIFPKLFVISINERKKKKAKPGRCSANKLYDFCWCLFIAAKGEEPNRRTDLVLSLHLLLCCIDLIFVNAVLDDRRDIIRPNFAGLPYDWNNDDFDVSSVKNYCIVRQLCELVSADYMEVANLKRSSWKDILTKFIKHKTLLCTPSEVISNIYFEPNLKSLNNTYEQFILSVGEFDERIFLNSEKDKSLHMNSSSRGVTGTPVSSAATKLYLENIATKDISKDFVSHIGDEHLKMLEARLDRLKSAFFDKYPKTDNTTPAEDVFKYAKALYYEFLYKIIPNELKIKPQLDPKVILENETLQVTLIVCCVEIIMFLHEVRLEFPWVLKCFALDPYYFYRIIEIVVQNHENILTRSAISHLNKIESKCLDHLAWLSDSSLWNAITKHVKDIGPLPSYEQVDHRNINSNGSSCRKTEESRLHGSFFQSPCTGAPYIKTTGGAESARRDLFNAGTSVKAKSEVDRTKEVSPPKPRAGSLSLFFRKFYELAYGRMSKLCEGLQMKNSDHLDLIWTIFEHCIINKTDIMQDRHLDQIIMCTIYVLIKVKDVPKKNFTEIMSVCRNVLKTTSSIYRQVRLNSVEGQPCYGDIIKFYNEIYVQSVSPFALNFADKTKQENNLLSPHPPDRLLSPVKLANCQFYVQSLNQSDIPKSPNVITYEFNKSPAKDLKKINEKVNGKRVGDEETPVLVTAPTGNNFGKRLKKVIDDRSTVG